MRRSMASHGRGVARTRPTLASVVSVTLVVIATLIGCGCTDNNTMAGQAANGGTVNSAAGKTAKYDPQILDRGTFFIDVKETMEGKPPKDSIARYLLMKQMILHGFVPVSKLEKARYVITGEFTYKYHKEVTFDFGGTSQHLEHQYAALVELTLKDTKAAKDSDEAEEFFDVPEPGMINGRTEKEDAKRDIRRYAATKISERMVSGKMLLNAEVKKLEYALGDPFEPRTFNQIIDEYVEIGHKAVPYLLTLTLDDRPVKLKGEYPGYTGESLQELSYYHIADKALSEILKRDSALRIDSTEDYYKRVIIAWFWAWEDEQGIPKKYQTAPAMREKTVPAPVGG